MNLKKHARSELRRAGLLDDAIAGKVMELVSTLSDQDHSTKSLRETVAAFVLLGQLLPLTELTGNDDEWMDGEEIQLNKRCPRVYRRSDGRCFDSEGYYEETEEGIVYSSKLVTFPYTPDTEPRP